MVDYGQMNCLISYDYCNAEMTSIVKFNEHVATHKIEYFAQSGPKANKVVRGSANGIDWETIIEQCGCCPRYHGLNYQKHTRINMERDRKYVYRWYNGANNLYFLKQEIKQNRFDSYRAPKAILRTLFEKVDIVNFYRGIRDGTLTLRGKNWLTLCDGVCEPPVYGKARFYMLISANLKSFYIGSTVEVLRKRGAGHEYFKIEAASILKASDLLQIWK